jgi:hypothetical protein
MRQIYERKVAVLNRGGLATEVKDRQIDTHLTRAVMYGWVARSQQRS